jgi:hypothetical protein
VFETRRCATLLTMRRGEAFARFYPLSLLLAIPHQRT